MTASAFTLAKTMRDLQEANSVKHLVEGGIIKTEGGPEVGETIVSSIGGSAGRVLHSWLAFGASISLTAWGLLNLPIADERKVFLATSGLLLLTSTMSLVKAVRDRIDARRLSALLEHLQHLQEKGKERDREMDEVIEIDRSTSSLETF